MPTVILAAVAVAGDGPIDETGRSILPLRSRVPILRHDVFEHQAPEIPSGSPPPARAAALLPTKTDAVFTARRPCGCASDSAHDRWDLPALHTSRRASQVRQRQDKVLRRLRVQEDGRKPPLSCGWHSGSFADARPRRCQQKSGSDTPNVSDTVGARLRTIGLAGRDR